MHIITDLIILVIAVLIGGLWVYHDTQARRHFEPGIANRLCGARPSIYAYIVGIAALLGAGLCVEILHTPREATYRITILMLVVITAFYDDSRYTAVSLTEKDATSALRRLRRIHGLVFAMIALIVLVL